MKAPSYLTASSSSTINGVLRNCKFAFICIGILSFLINLLALTGSIYMIQVYDRVLPSRSVPTLIGLTLLLVALLIASGLLDILRSRITTRIGVEVDGALRDKVYPAVVTLPLRARLPGDPTQPIRDLDTIRSFMSGAGPITLFDLPWIPLYLALVFALHFWLGMLAVVGALVLVGLTILTEMYSREPAKAAATSSSARQTFIESVRANAEATRAMGMTGRMGRTWSDISAKYLQNTVAASDVNTNLSTIAKTFRQVLQSATLGLGAYLVVQGEATGGVMIASSITSARALAPIDAAIAQWRYFVSARQSLARLTHVLGMLPAEQTSVDLPKPTQRLTVDGLYVTIPTFTTPTVQNVSFAVKAGSGLGVVGPSGSGKSTLSRALVGVWPAVRGTVRIDGATLDQWDPDKLGVHIGYLPQDIELFEGTVSDNIARFDGLQDSDAIIAAAKAAAVHDMILQLADGYQTRMGPRGSGLSAGQRQRIALARALYKDPFLVVLDEPNSNLDAAGDVALTQAILSIRARKGIVVVIAHRPSALEALDQMLIMSQGQLVAAGPKAEVLKKFAQPAAPPRTQAAAPSLSAQPKA